MVFCPELIGTIDVPFTPTYDAHDSSDFFIPTLQFYVGDTLYVKTRFEEENEGTEIIEDIDVINVSVHQFEPV